MSNAKNAFERQKTAKELDEETGLYYYGARYLDPKYSMWISADPALSDYMAGSSAGCGGIYNHINLNLYHYAGNNPVRYTDPDGRLTFDEETKTIIADLNDKKDMKLAGHVFMEYQYDGYVCKAVDSKTNQSVTFTRARELYAFMEGTYEQYLENDRFNSDEFFLDLLNLVTATETIGTVRSRLNTALTTVSVVIDGYKASVCLWNNDIPGAINSTIDTMIDSIGYIPFYGTLISVELKYSKRGIIFAANEMARAQIELERYAVRRCYEILPYIIPRF